MKSAINSKAFALVYGLVMDFWSVLIIVRQNSKIDTAVSGKKALHSFELVRIMLSKVSTKSPKKLSGM